MSDSEVSNIEDDIKSEEKVVVKNKSKRQFTEKQLKATRENIKKAISKRTELKPLTIQTVKDTRDLKTLERMVKAKEAAAKKQELLKKLAELDESIDIAKEVQQRQVEKKQRPTKEDSVEEEVVIKKPKKKVQKIIVEDEPSEDETIVVKRKRGRPTNKQQEQRVLQQRPAKEQIKELALKTAIEQQTNQLLYNSLFGL